ncbi:hypothetical protein [Streptomyces griseiscabiei]|uniref:Secreted protein n=2 Tax=Streptomyces griseiscabiei TaxID=2993540 RepID=A0ABU4LH73_9ACTN|nr:hypothetical protein [Streptomyces griseiscabiei]MBZ3907985.1 hypothetical protein [Streptomyces griseiscabiei]MDX2915134.1 hypothetical protein [Streptomyces griseiscabiei]
MEDMDVKNRAAAKMRTTARSTEEAVAQLDHALRGVGIVLPSLRVDPITGASELPYPLVELGCCNLQVAANLAAVLRKAAET